MIFKSATMPTIRIAETRVEGSLEEAANKALKDSLSNSLRRPISMPSLLAERD